MYACYASKVQVTEKLSIAAGAASRVIKTLEKVTLWYADPPETVLHLKRSRAIPPGNHIREVSVGVKLSGILTRRIEMEYLIGFILSAAVAGFAVIVGLDRERSFFATAAIVIATYYVLFAVQGASARTLGIEIIVSIVFSAMAVLGFKTNLWFTAVATAGHGVFDFLHHSFIDNPGVPPWWPGFCGAFDVLFGSFLAVLLVTRSRSALNRTDGQERSHYARP
jgi:hypothetical protein